jgi:hypothetical protein
MRVIKDGLSPDDRIIVNGMARIRPGVKVAPQQQGVKPSEQPQALANPAASPKTE